MISGGGRDPEFTPGNREENIHQPKGGIADQDTIRNQMTKVTLKDLPSGRGGKAAKKEEKAEPEGRVVEGDEK